MQSGTQATWSWKIAAYLFLAGTGSGAYAVAELAGITRFADPSAEAVGAALGAPLVFGGMLFLIADLGAKKNAVRAFVNVRTSWMARGAWIISVFSVLDAAQLAGVLWHWDWPPAMGLVTVVFAVATMFYTGFLLRACRGIPFWSTALLPLLFLVSASSTGAMALVLADTFRGASLESLSSFSRADAVLILVEALVIVVYLERSRRSGPSRLSVELWMKGRLAPGFWVGVVACGLLVPLIMDAYPANVVAVTVSMSLGLAGGLVLRKIVLSAGTRDMLLGISPSNPGPFWGKVLREAASK